MTTRGEADTLGLLDSDAPGDGDTGRLVEVAIDAAGAAGGHAFTYSVPPRLEPLADGEAVLVTFGRRQALGIVLGPGLESPGIVTRPIGDRVRADGPLLPALALALARDIADRYLAPPALVLRAMLPPGLLERFELVAERRPDAESSPAALEGGSGASDPAVAELLTQLGDGPRPVRGLVAPEGRPALVRRLRSLQAAGLIDLDWTLLGASSGPRYMRMVRRVEPGDDVAEPRAQARRLGPRQVAALVEIERSGAAGVAAGQLAASHGSSVVRGLAARGLVVVTTETVERRPLAARSRPRRGSRPPATDLTPEQAQAVAAIRRAIDARGTRPTLLDGVTGAGKTAIYAEAIVACLDAGRQALVLVPEVALALPLVDRLRSDLDAEIAMLHSGLSDGERSDEWRRIRRGDADIVVGTRLAVLAPLADIGLVIVDEEHDPAYKSDRTPRLQARDVALRLGILGAAAVVLGSATPAVETEGRARAGEYARFRLADRVSGRPPAVEVADMRTELNAGNRTMLSRRLGAAIADLDRAEGDQAILVINRRGSASVVLCRDCGTVQACTDCTLPLVYHQAGVTLRCHHCGRATPLASRCPACGSARIRYLGGGTERLEREVRAAFPDHRVARLDRDVVERRGAAARILDDLADGRLDILVGTSLVTKGIDVPTVTLVGIVSADIALNLPDERAAERTYQLLAQAVGRAGRGRRPGRAIIQTYQPDHPAIRAVELGRPASFYDAELDLRRRFGSPPFGRLVKLTVALPDRAAAEAAGDELADRLRGRASALGVAADVAGPAPAYIARRADRWRFNVVIRAEDPIAILGEPPGAPWSVDVDPESLL